MRFMPTKPYYQLAANERTGLQAEEADLVKVVDDPKTDWVTKERASARLSEVRRLLGADEFARRQGQQPVERQAQHEAQREAQQTAQHEAEPVHTIQCAKGYRAISAPGQGSLIVPIDEKGT